MKDDAIAYGYNNVPKSKPKSMTIGGRQPLNRFSDKIRAEVLKILSTIRYSLSICSVPRVFHISFHQLSFY